MKKNLSIIVLSYNTKKTTIRCLNSVVDSVKKSKKTIELIIIDNASSDGSRNELRNFSNRKINNNISVKLFELNKNQGFSKGNNIGLSKAYGEYILFLNSDIQMDGLNFDRLIEYLNKNKEVGVLTVKINLQDNGIDPASHRGFPTIWRSFCYFSGLEKLFGKVPILNILFGGYHLLNMNFNEIHEIDSPTGAFFLTRKKLLEKLKGFDESFFMYGEDIDLAYRIKKQNYKIIYHPFFSITHLKSVSGFKSDNSFLQNITSKHFYRAMKIFYKKHYEKNYPLLINRIVYSLINFKEKIK